MRDNYHDPREMEYVTFDIETTGFGAADELTAITLHLGETEIADRTVEPEPHYYTESDYHVIARTDGPGETDALDADELTAETGLDVGVTTVKSESALITAARGFVREFFLNDTVAVAYKGETYRQAFDLGFLRRRAEEHGMEHPFKGVLYLDAYEPIKRERVNTGAFSTSGMNKSPLASLADHLDLDDGGYRDDIAKRIDEYDPTIEAVREWAAEHNDGEVPLTQVTDLDAVYATLPGTEPVEYDPFDDSGKCVEAWENGDIESIALHNIADVYQTRRILEVLLRQVRPKELQPDLL